MISFTGRSDIFPLSSLLSQPFGCAATLNGSGFHELHVERDRDLVADQDAAGLQRGIPRQPVILAVDPGGGRQPDTRIAPGILRRLGRAFDSESDSASHAMDRQVALHRQLTVAAAPDLRRPEAQRW